VLVRERVSQGRVRASPALSKPHPGESGARFERFVATSGRKRAPLTIRFLD
jgi:hypothetical protein